MKTTELPRAEAGSAASLRRRLVRWLLPSLLVSLALGLAGADLVGRHAAAVAYDQALMAAAEDVALGIQVTAHRPDFEFSKQSEDMLRQDARDSIFFAVRDGKNGFVAGDADLPLAPIVSLARGVSVELTFRGQPVRALSMRFERGQLPFTVTVAETLGKRRDMAWSVLAYVMLPGMVALLLAGLIVWITVRQGLSPLGHLERELQARSATDLSPVDLAQVPREVQSLVASLNGLLGRLDQSVRAHQSFVADAAHQLRTPLAGIQAQIELLPALDDDATASALPRLRRAVSRAIRLTHQLLALSRSERDRAALDIAWLDLAELVGQRADDWVHRAIALDIDFGFELAPARLRGDPFLIAEMMENLVDNALRYAGAGRSVTVSTSSEEGAAIFRVDDSGPGIAPDQRALVLQRFYRPAASIGDGSGLGLAIVLQIVQQHDGSLGIDDSPLGGARVSARLPVRGSLGAAPPARASA